MPANPDPIETAILDLGVFRYRLVQHFKQDNVIDADERMLLRLFDEPHRELSRIHRCWNAFASLIRNGLTRRTGDKARDAGLTIVVDNTGKVSNVIPLFPDSGQGPQAA